MSIGVEGDVIELDRQKRLMDSFISAGWDGGDIEKFIQSDTARTLHGVFKGTHEIVSKRRIISSNKRPWCHDELSLEENIPYGEVNFNPFKVELYLTEEQEKGIEINGNYIRQVLSERKPLNANFLDYLLKNPDEIPEHWKFDDKGDVRYIFFFGTIYRRGESLYVRGLAWDNGPWREVSRWLGKAWHGVGVAALYEV